MKLADLPRLTRQSTSPPESDAYDRQRPSRRMYPGGTVASPESFWSQLADSLTVLQRRIDSRLQHLDARDLIGASPRRHCAES